VNAVPEAIVTDVDPKDAAYRRMCAHYGVIPEPFPHKAIAFAALQGEREDKHCGGWDARERALCMAHLRRRPPEPLRALRPRAAPSGAPIGEPVRSAPEPLRGPDFIAELHERRAAAEDIPVTDLAAALGLSSSAAQDAYRRWCEAQRVEPLPGARGRSTWHPWVISRYLAGFEPAEIAAALTAASTYVYPVEQVNRCLIRHGIAKDPLHKALRAKF
jgi:hypothetical protein